MLKPNKWVNSTKCFEYYADRDYFGTHFITIFWHRFSLPDVKTK